MFRFIALSALLAVAAAAPEAEAEPWYYGHHLVSPHAIGVTGQTVSVEAATAGHLATKPFVYGLGYPYAHYGGHYLGKREAESKADADPYYYYAHHLVSPHAIGVTGQTVSVEAAAAGHLATKAVYGYGYPYAHFGHYLGKREAESKADADPYLLYGHGLYGHGYLGYKPFITSVGAVTTYSNGAVTPTNTPAVQAATNQHLAAKVADYAAHGYPLYHHLGKREAEAEADPYLLYGHVGAVGVPGAAVTSVAGGLTTYANGAVVPTDPNGLAATAAHHLSKAYYPYGLYHGYHYLGKREAESDPEAEADPYFYYHGAYPFRTSVGALTTYSNGAVVPTDLNNQAATAAHLATTYPRPYGFYWG